MASGGIPSNRSAPSRSIHAAGFTFGGVFRLRRACDSIDGQPFVFLLAGDGVRGTDPGALPTGRRGRLVAGRGFRARVGAPKVQSPPSPFSEQRIHSEPILVPDRWVRRDTAKVLGKPGYESGTAKIRLVPIPDDHARV